MEAIDRTRQPQVKEMEHLSIRYPRPIVMPNRVTLHVLDIGDSEVVRMDFLVGGGRWAQRQPLQALFTNRMLREGTRRFTAARLAETLDYHGAWLELSNAAEYSFLTLHSLNKYLPQTLEVLESMLKEPLFPEEELKVVVDNNVQQFLVNSSKVDFLAHRALLKAVYGGEHPCGRLIQREDYEAIDTGLLREFYDRHYHSDNLTIYLSGRVTDETLRRVEECFGRESFGTCLTSPEKREYPILTDRATRHFVELPGAMQSGVRMGSLSVARNHPDYLKTRVLITLFGGYFGSRLMSNIREEKGYTYGIAAGIIPYPDSGLLVINAETTNEWVEPLIAEVYHEMDRLRNDLVSEQELTVVKNYMMGEMCRSCESAFSLADSWISIRTSGAADTYYRDAVEAIRSITPAEIRDLAIRYLRKEEMKEAVAGEGRA
ncbi:MAG: insulinase family protein [Bacteroides sp.]|nr:insulinase family protein [Bacteroides sp.]